MDAYRGWPAVMAAAVLGVIFLVAAFLYANGTLQILASGGHRNHYTHAAVFGILAVLAFVGASFLRPETDSI